ncbi:MAG: 30S ribosomal protein S20 [Nitrospirota bacterium]|nr:30S ribosomal protein S20 [Nitrospirota bacterium]
MKRNKSAIKRVTQAEKRAAINRSSKKLLKTLSKKVESESASKNIENAKASLKSAIVAIDRAAIKGRIHKKTASRKVSRLTRLVNTLSPA